MPDYGDHERVETAWRRILADAGIDRSVARSITAELQSQQALTSGATDPEQVRRHVTAAIDRLDLGAYGVPEARRDDVKADLEAALEAGLDGDLEGPVALRTPGGDRIARPTNVAVDPPTDDDDSEAATEGDGQSRSVETAWRDRLAAAGVDRSAARAITAELQSRQALTSGATDAETVRRHVTAAIDRLDLTAYGVDEAEADDVESDLEAILEDGLTGDLEGPVALRTPSGTPTYQPKDTVLDDEPTAGDDGPRAGRREGPSPDLGTPQESAGITGRTKSPEDEESEPDEEVVERLREELSRIADEQDLSLADVETAAEAVTGSRSIEGLDGPSRQVATELRRLVDGGAATDREVRAAVRSLDGTDE